MTSGEPKKYLQSTLVDIDEVHPTITAGYKAKASPMPSWEPKWLSKEDLCKIGAFPKDYNFCNLQIPYLIGMSVPPIVVAYIATEINKQWLNKINNNQ